MLDLGQPMLDPVLAAAHVKHMRHVFRCWTVHVAWREGELDAIVGEDRVDFVRDSRDQSFQKGGCRRAAGLLDQLHECEFAGAVDGDVEVEFALGGLEAMSI